MTVVHAEKYFLNPVNSNLIVITIQIWFELTRNQSENVKSIGKWLLQSKFGLNYQDSEKIFLRVNMISYVDL